MLQPDLKNVVGSSGREAGRETQDALKPHVVSLILPDKDYSTLEAGTRPGARFRVRESNTVYARLSVRELQTLRPNRDVRPT